MSRERSSDHDQSARSANRDGILWLTDRAAADDVLDSSHHAHSFGGVSAIGTCFGCPMHCRGPRQTSGASDQSP